MRRRSTLSVDEARRIALAAQGFAEPRPAGRVDRRRLRRLFERVGAVQIDSVNVLVRSHYLPAFSRFGPYDRSLLDRLAYEDHHLFEYWGHDASLIPAELHPLLRWRMGGGDHKWTGLRRWATENRELTDTLARAVVLGGPLSAGDLDAGAAKKGPWWGWSDTKRALEILLYTGRVGAVRRSTFERAYCDPSDVVPPGTLERPTPPEHDAKVALLERAALGHGVGTAVDLADYFRFPIKETRPLLEAMAGDGILERVTVDGWKDPAYLHPKARLPRVVDACALVSPFDSVMWGRDRIERLYGFRYRIEIYVPKPKRVYGYYVLPFLLGDRYVARVDLKADRADSKLLVQSAFVEPAVDVGEVVERLAGELRTMAAWLGLDGVVVAKRGDLAAPLARALR